MCCNDRDKNKERKQRFSWKQIQLCVENLRWNKLRRKNGWASKYQQEASQNLSVAAKEGKIKAACIALEDWDCRRFGDSDDLVGGVHHPKPVALVQHLDSNIKSDRKQAEQSSKVVCEAHSPGATKHTCACPHLGNWSDRHEAKNMERKVNAYPSHKTPGRDYLGKQNLQWTKKRRMA